MKNLKHVKLTLIAVVMAIATTVSANNINVSNITLTGQDAINDFTLVQFDIAWENSWRVSTGQSNWDAAWVFVKYRVISGLPIWNHATLHYVNGTGSGDGHTEPLNTDIASSNDNGAGGAYGVFIYRNADMSQANVSYTGVQLRWDYGVDGLADNDSVEVCVFAVEMVYVPQESFYAGDIAPPTIFGQFEEGTSSLPLQINSELALTLGGGGAGSLSNNNAGGMPWPDDFNDVIPQTLPAGYPKGYNAFYCMKYEISQKQYTEFLNKLDPTQAGNRAYTGGGSRNGISGAWNNYNSSYQYVACNFLSWADLSAYLDWAALRPMTELEYEKACRGPVATVQQEYAWGNFTTASSAYTLINPGLNNEGIITNYSTTSGNASYNTTDGTINGPLRVGIFASHVNNSGRITAGATWYGIMEMSGNLRERTVTVGNATGRSFTVTHGDGEIDASGNANVTNWPGNNAIGVGSRGGSWDTPDSYYQMRVSDRYFENDSESSRSKNNGGRGVRRAP